MIFSRLPSLFLMMLVFFVPAASVSGDAWWGEGARSADWVRENGGSIIRYEITGGKSDRYKAMMFRDGKYVEVEFGKNATFDDAKDGLYEIKFYKCEESCAPHETNNKTKIRKSDDRKGIIFVTARPGETTYIEYNTDKDKAKIVAVKPLGGVKTDPNAAPVVPPKPTYTPEQLLEFAAQREEGQVCVYEPDVSGFAETLDFDLASDLPNS